MPASTSPDNIVYPVLTDGVAPLNTKFSDLATSVQNALVKVRNEAAPSVASQSARDALFPTPAQGNTVYRSDLNITERYSAAYNASTNINARDTAGWYPINATPIQRRFSGVTTNTAAQASGFVHNTYTIKRRTFTQRVYIRVLGLLSHNNNGATGSFGATVSTGGTIIQNTAAIILQNSGTGYSGLAIVDIAAGTGADVTINMIVNSSASGIAANIGTDVEIAIAGEY